MTKRTNDDSQADEAPEVGESPALKRPKAYSSLRRDLSEKELVNIGSVNLMIDEIDRLNAEIQFLDKFRDRFHDVDKKYDVLAEKVTAQKLSEILYNIAISVGALLTGTAGALWDNKFYGKGALIAGVSLWVAGSTTKLVRTFKK